MKKVNYNLWVAFNAYTGNFEREFIAYMLGKEIGDYNKGNYAPYTNDYITNNSPLKKMEDILHYTAQEVNDWTEETFYNIDRFPSSSKECNAIFIQLSEKPTLEMLMAFASRLYKFPDFYTKTENYPQENLQVLGFSFEREDAHTKDEKSFEA